MSDNEIKQLNELIDKYKQEILTLKSKIKEQNDRINAQDNTNRYRNNIIKELTKELKEIKNGME